MLVRYFRFFAVMAGMIFLLPARAEEQLFTSSERQTGLIELYTSEGCSSCPPADKWLSSLQDNPELWKKIIPLAFHVDYWDYIGWKDRFAMPTYTQRQRNYARQHSLRTIYTPGFIYNGREWRNWFVKRFFDFPEGEVPGVLSLAVEADHARVRFNPVQPLNTRVGYNLALLGLGLKTEIKAGENSGRTLNHNFVVLDLNHGPMEVQDGVFTAYAPLPKSDIRAARYAVAVWINRGDDISPIQATGGYIKE